MTDHKNHQSMLSISDLLRKTFHLLETHFLEFLFAIAVPVIIAYVALWIGSAMFITDFNNVQTFADLTELFSFEQRTLGIIILCILIAVFANLLGFIAAPLVAIEQETITIKNIFPRALKYFGTYLVYIVLFGIFLLLTTILAYLTIFIIDVLLGFISKPFLDTVNVGLTDGLTTLFLTITSFFLSFAVFFMIDKQLGAWQSMKHSVQMVASHFWGVLIRLAIGIMCVAVIGFILQYIPVVGTTLTLIVGILILTPYQYFMYKDLTQ